MNLEEHKKLLKKVVKVAEKKSTNPRNLESHWYAMWNIILMYWFCPKLVVAPQHVLTYRSEDRDGNTRSRKLIPNFTVMGYHTNANNQVYRWTYMIVEYYQRKATKGNERYIITTEQTSKRFVFGY